MKSVKFAFITSLDFANTQENVKEIKLDIQIQELIDENSELNGNIGVTEMLFDAFKEEMMDLYGHKMKNLPTG